MQRNGSINSEDKVRKKHMRTGENEREMVGERKGEKNRDTQLVMHCTISILS